jgi:hypothetical protein
MEKMVGQFSKSVELRRKVEEKKEKIDEKDEYKREYLQYGLEKKSRQSLFPNNILVYSSTERHDGFISERKERLKERFTKTDEGYQKALARKMEEEAHTLQSLVGKLVRKEEDHYRNFLILVSYH